jgi:predicted nucleic-acid-binding protein
VVESYQKLTEWTTTMSKYTNEQYDTAFKLIEHGYTYREASEQVGIPIYAIRTKMRDENLIVDREDAVREAIDLFREHNLTLADKLSELTNKTIDKALTLVDEVDNLNDIYTAVKIIETVAKTAGLAPKETQTNVQINAITGFEFVMLDSTDVLEQKTIEV